MRSLNAFWAGAIVRVEAACLRRGERNQIQAIELGRSPMRSNHLTEAPEAAGDDRFLS